jgi:Putative beta-barrel porin 2
MLRKPVRRTAAVVLMIMGILSAHWEARAQSAVGAGPLTASLPDTEPTTGILMVGPIRFAPGVTIREIGYDSNVFDEPPEQSPKEDYVFSAMPDVSAFVRMRLFRVSAYAGSELTYYQKYESERSSGYSGRSRIDLLFSRVRPFVGFGRVRTRQRANGEIDVRADRLEEELSGGVAFDLSAHSLIYGSWARNRSQYENAIQDGIDLSQTLTRERDEYQAGIKTDLTPLLSVQLYGSYHEDVFKFDPRRDTKNTSGLATFRIAPEAVFTGFVTVGYKDLRPSDPFSKPFRGLTGSAAISIPILEIGRITVTGQRGTEYSFDAEEAYFVENSAFLSYTHRIAGAVDVQARAGRSLFDYSARDRLPAHKDTLDVAGGSVGYNLRNRTRIAVNYEYSKRRAPALASRNYDRRRIYLSWLFAF